jgi:HlyD family secretion protein
MRTPLKAFVSAGSLVLIILVLVLLVFWRSANKSGADAPSGNNNSAVHNPAPGTAEVVFAVEAAIARKGDLVKRLTTTGTLRARREVQIVARVGGNIVTVPVQNGDYVRAGQLLLRTDDTEYSLALERATTALLGAQIEFKSMISYDPAVILDSSTTGSDSLRFKEKVQEARKGLHSLEKQYAEGKVSFAEYARAKRDYESDIAYFTAYRGDVMANKSGLSQARETYERSKLDFIAARITAPFAGYIADLDLSSGMKISAGMELFKLVDVSSLCVDVDVLETEVGKVHRGGIVDVTVPAYPGQQFRGTVVAMNPIVNPKSKTVKVTIELIDGRRKGLRL